MLQEEVFPELQQIEQGLKNIQINVTRVRPGRRGKAHRRPGTPALMGTGMAASGLCGGESQRVALGRRCRLRHHALARSRPLPCIRDATASLLPAPPRPPPRQVRDVNQEAEESHFVVEEQVTVVAAADMVGCGGAL